MEHVWTKIMGANMGFTVHYVCKKRNNRQICHEIYVSVYIICIISYGSMLDDDDDKQNDLPGAI